jgi:glutamate--cysteine ligase
VNIDFSDEADCLKKMRAALTLSPLLYALFANSPIMEDRPTGFLSTRGEIWSRTDADRTGLLPTLFAPQAGFQTYIDYALDVPMYFIHREGTFIDFTKTRLTFRRYLEEGFAGHHATMADWDLHLSTLFPEVRLRPQIEVRCADSLPPHLTLAMAALVKGVLYDDIALQETTELFKNIDQASLSNILCQSWRLGLKTPISDGATLREIALQTLDIAARGLSRQRRHNGRGLDETMYLHGIRGIAESGETLAERLLTQWHGTRKDKLALLKKHCGFGLDWKQAPCESP